MTRIFYPEAAVEALFSHVAPTYPGYTLEQAKGDLRQLGQLRTLTWDGDLITKAGRERLYKAGLVARIRGWNLVTLHGLEFMLNNDVLKP